MNNDGFGAIRVSYSILNAWASGDIDRAVAPYTGVKVESTEALEFGKKMHGIWERYVRKHKAIPKIFGGRKLEAPEIELATKRVRKLTDWCVISGVLDVKDGTTGIDWKTGKASATDYTNSKQSEVYQVLYPELKRFEFYCKNQHVHHTDKNHITAGIVYLNRKTLEDGLNWILTMAAELREYLINNGYGNRLDQERKAELQPIRMKSCQETLEKLGYEVEVANHTLLIIHHPSGIDIQLFPYSGWWSGKRIGSDRGFRKLLKKLKELK